MHLNFAQDFTRRETRIRIVITLAACKDQDVMAAGGERKGNIAEQSAGRGLIGLKIAVYENEPRQ